MNKLNEIREQLATEENDLKALGLRNQLIREVRVVKFEDEWLPKMQRKVVVRNDKQLGRYTFEFGGHGVMDFYPKADNLLFRKLNRWKKPALKWIIKELQLEADDGILG